MSRSRSGPDELGVSEFKRRCLELLERIHRDGKELVVTKRGRAIVRVVPLNTAAQPLKGILRDQIEFVGDIVEVDCSSDWEAVR